MSKIEIDVGGGGTGTIKIDGHDLSQVVSGINVRIRPGKLTKVYLELVEDTEIKVEGQVLPDGVIERCGIDGWSRYEKQ